MKSTSFDALARRAGSGQDRRTSLKLLGAAALATAAAGPVAAKAGKAGKKAKRKCKKQGNPCRAFAEEICDLLATSDPQGCKDAFKPCCNSIQKCKGPAFFSCVEEQLLAILT
jgi:hypothetical protein